MKRYWLMITLLWNSICFASDNVINIYNWSGYLPDSVISQFEKETGIHINYSTYDSNETLYAKLKANPHAGYDIIVPSTYYIDRMRQQDMLEKIDKSKISNFSFLNQGFLNKPYDPGNNYSIPYLWSTSCIVYNDKYYSSQQITAWQALWDTRYREQLLILDDIREVFSMALLVLGYSPNDLNPEHIKQAYLKLQSLMPNVKLFNAETVASIYVDEDILLGMGWSGDIFKANQENPHIHSIYPKEGFIISLDSLAIPRHAPHLENAYKFINFMLKPEIAKTISIETGFATPNLEAVKLLPKRIVNNPIMYPSPEVLKHGQFQSDVGKISAIYERYWELLKISN